MSTTIFLEAHYFGEEREDLRLPCDTVAAAAGGLIVTGIRLDQLQKLKWRPDYLSYWEDGQLLRLAVGPWVALAPMTVRFTLR